MNEHIAVKADWKTQEMPIMHARFTLERHFSPEGMETLRRGFIPQSMDDKWFMYMEGQTLYAHRSWTGHCIYMLTFREGSDVIDVTVNRDREQYTCVSIDDDIQLLQLLLGCWSGEVER